MNVVARVFVGLNLILAAGFLMAAGTFLHQQQVNKETLEERETELLADIEQKKNDLLARDTQITNLQNDFDRSKATITTLEGEKTNLTTKLEGEQREKRNVERSLQTLQGTHDALANQVGEMKGELGTLREQVDTYRNQSIEDRDRAREADVARAEAVTARDQVSALLAATKDGKGAVEKILAAANNELGRYKAVYPPPPTGDAPKIDGQVLRYDAATKLVEVNRGSSQGLRIGHEYDVVRGADFICTIRIDRVEDQRAVGSIKVPMPGRQPRSGDRATKL